MSKEQRRQITLLTNDVYVQVRVEVYPQGSTPHSLTNSEIEKIADSITDSAAQAVHDAPFVDVPRWRIKAEKKRSFQ